MTPLQYSPAITQLVTEGLKAFALKDFDQAASHYADACGLFNEENGSDDADLLLLYGKALFQSGVEKSGVLGDVKPERQENKQEEEEGPKEGDEGRFHFDEGLAQEVDDDRTTEVEAHDEESESEESGDENADENENGEAEEDEQTDLEMAWDILDLARSLFAAEVETNKLKIDLLPIPYLKSDDTEPENEDVQQIKKLSEVLDLLGEVSLESEQFPQAALDFESSLNLRCKLYDSSSSALVSESHYKLSLALEFCVEDPDSRAKAAEQMKLAIQCVKGRQALPSTSEQNKEETTELLRDLEERYKELQKDPQQEIQAQQLDLIKGILGEATANPEAITSIAAQSVPKAVNDLSQMVKKRKAPEAGNQKKQKKN